MLIDLPQLERLTEAELPTAHFVMLEHDIVWVRYKPYDEEISLEDALLHTAVLDKLNGGQPVHTIVDFRDIHVAFTNEARDYFAQNEQHSALRMSQALILSSLAHRIVGNFYLKFNRPNCPARIFANPQDALEWIQSLK